MSRLVSYGQFGGVTAGPQSRAFADNGPGAEWLDHRENAGAQDAAFSADHRQKIQKQLGGEAWLGEGASADTPPRYTDTKGYPQTGIKKSLSTPPRGVKEQAGLHFDVSDRAASPEILGGPAPTREPVQHVYRGVSEDEFQQAKGQGFFKSDGRGAIEPDWEGTNAATSIATANEYRPKSGTSRIVKLSVNQDDGWFSSSVDDYARTRSQIPWDRVQAHTDVLKAGAPTNFRDQVVADQKAGERK